MERSRTNPRGSVLVEVMLSSALLLLIAMYIIATISAGRESVAAAGYRVEAALLAEEGLEATRNIRDADFTNISNGTYGLSTAGNEWGFSGSSDSNAGFTRAITIADGPDANTKEVTATVDWEQTPFRSGSISMVTYLANWLIAKAAPGGDWSNPSILNAIDFPSSNDARRIKIVGGYAYIVLAAGSPDFRILDISDPLAVSYAGGTAINATALDLAVSGNYAYVAGSANLAELSVVDISNPASPSVVVERDLTGTHNGRSILVNGSYAYVGRVTGTSNEFMVVDISTPTNPTTVSSVNIGGSALDLAIDPSGDYIYLASDHTTQELQVIDVSTPGSPFLEIAVDLPGTNSANALKYVNGYLFIGREDGLFIVVDVSDPTSPSIGTEISTSSHIWDIALNADGTLAFLAQNGLSNEFQVVDISDPGAPSVISSVDTDSILYSVAYDATHDLCFAVGSDDDGEMTILQPG